MSICTPLCFIALLLAASTCWADEPFMVERLIAGITRQDQSDAIRAGLLKRELTLSEAITALTTFARVSHEEYMTYAHQPGARGSLVLVGGVTLLWEIEPGYGAIVTTYENDRVYLLHPSLLKDRESR